MTRGGHGEDRPCRRAATALERLAAGGSVDLPTDADGDASRLYDAVREVAATYGDEDAGREREREHTDRRSQLYDVTADPSLSGTEKVDRLLELGCAWFGTDNAYLSRIDRESDRYVVEHAVGDEFVTEGAEVSLSETFCRRAIDDGEDILGIYDAVAEGFDDDPGYAHSGIACYIGGRVDVDGDLYGTFCFFDDDPAAAPFTDLDRALVDMMARWVSYELERREHERDLRLRDRAMAAAPVGITISDATEPENPLVYANDRFETMTGYDHAAVVGESYDVFYPDDAGDAAARVFTARAAAAPVTETVRAERADGERFWMRVSLAPVTDDDGVVTHVVTFHEDVTERVQNARRLEAVVENTAYPMFIKDREGTYVWANEATTDVFGLDREAVVGATDADLFDEDSLPAIREVDERVLDREERAVRETETTVDGERRVWLEEKHPYRNERGEVVGIMGISRDITERASYEAELAAERDRFQALVENLPGIVYRCANERGWPMSFVSDGCGELTGHAANALESGDVDWGADVVHPDDRERVWATVQAALDADEPFQVTYRIETADGDTRWVWERGRGVDENGDGVVLEGFIFDVTDRERRKRALDRLHDATRELLTVEDEAAAADLVVSATDDALGGGAAAFYRFDASANELRAVAHTERFAAGDPPSFPVGDDSAPWTCFVSGETTAFDDAADVAAGWTPLDGDAGGLLVPVGEHGVFVVAAAAGPPADERRQVVEAAAATAAAAFDRLSSEAALRDRERELEARNDRLERQVQVTDIMRTINQSLVAAESRDAVETAVCEGLASADGLAFAWVGGWDADRGRLVPRTWAGDGGGYLDAVSLRADRTEPAVVAARDEAASVVNAVGDRVTVEPWAEQAAAGGFGAALAVPLAVDEHSHGVLAVYAADPGAFDDLQREVFRELGETIADAIEAVTARRALHADNYVELRLSVEAPDTLLSRLATAVGGTVEYDGSVGTGDDAHLFVTVAGADADATAAALADLVAVGDHRHVASSADGHAFEVAAAGDTVPATLARAGGSLRSVVADDDGSLSVVVDVPASADVREYVDRLRGEYQSVTLVGRRDVERTNGSRDDVVRELFEALTDRQLEVLRTAFLAGFFEWPRETTGEGVAEMLGVSQPTVNRHLRVAQRRLLAALFQIEPPTAVEK